MPGPGGAINAPGGQGNAAFAPGSSRSYQAFGPMMKAREDVPIFQKELFMGTNILRRIMRKKGNLGRAKWTGQRFEFAFDTSYGGSATFGGPRSDDLIASDAPMRGYLNEYKEVWGSLGCSV